MPFIEHEGRRILFVHIPKTGGTSIESALSSLGPIRLHTNGAPGWLNVTPQHWTYQDIRRMFGDDYFDFAYAVVRNPYDRIESEYRMHWLLAKEGFFSAPLEFSLWLENNLAQARRQPHHLDNHLRRQTDFISNKVHVLRFEEGISQILHSISVDLHLETPLTSRHELSTRSFGGRIDWDIPSRTLVNEFYKSDFDVLGYQKLGIHA